MANRAGDEQQVHSISGAARPHSEDLDGRVRRYVISMGFRTGCFLLVLVIDHPVRWVLAAAAVVIPYVAVVMANAGARRRIVAPVPVDRLALTGTVLPVQRTKVDS